MFKKLTLICLFCLPLIIASCSSDDPPPDNGGTSVTRVKAGLATTAVSATNVDDAQWANATEKIITLPNIGFSALARTSINAEIQKTASEINIKALTFNDTLYLRLSWLDNTFSVWPEAFEVKSQKPTDWENKATVYHEDQLLVMIDTVKADTVDTWYWRVMTTAIRELSPNVISGFAEGMHKVGTNLVSDNGNLNIVLDNPNQPGFTSLPTYVHRDSSLYNGFLLYLEDIYQQSPFDTLWTIGQKVPGWQTDSTVASSVKASTRLSRWDIWALSEWDNVANQYIVVLRRPMNTGFTDDLNMTLVDSVRVKLAVTDDFVFNLTGGSTSQGISDYFWLIF